jgi:hypothetical protein
VQAAAAPLPMRCGRPRSGGRWWWRGHRNRFAQDDPLCTPPFPYLDLSRGGRRPPPAPLTSGGGAASQARPASSQFCVLGEGGAPLTALVFRPPIDHRRRTCPGVGAGVWRRSGLGAHACGTLGYWERAAGAHLKNRASSAIPNLLARRRPSAYFFGGLVGAPPAPGFSRF